MGRSRILSLAFLPLLLTACSDCRPYLQRAAARLESCDPAGARAELEGASSCRDKEEFKQVSSGLEKPDPSAAGEHVKAAVDLLDLGDEAGARGELGKACQADPTNADARFLLDRAGDVGRSLELVRTGESRLGKCEAADARKDLEEALRLWPGNEKARGLLAGLGQGDADGARESEKAAKVFLAGGQVREAEGELAKACRLDPESATAKKLLAQLTADPNEYFRKQGFPFSDKSFPWTVQPGDSLSKLAAHYLRDEDLFYLLARYNGLQNPNDLRVGQTILIPGERKADDQPPPAPADTLGGRTKKPVPVVEEPSPPPPKSDCTEDPYRKAVQAWRRQDLDAAVALSGRAMACDPGNHNAEILRVQAIDAMVNVCRVAYQQGNCGEALTQCDRALKVDPDNRKALELRKQAVACKHR